MIIYNPFFYIVKFKCPNCKKETECPTDNDMKKVHCWECGSWHLKNEVDITKKDE